MRRLLQGGFFAAQAARAWKDIRAMSLQVSVPSVEDVQASQRAHGTFPPTQLVLMPKDSGKLKEVDALRPYYPEEAEAPAAAP